MVLKARFRAESAWNSFSFKNDFVNTIICLVVEGQPATEKDSEGVLKCILLEKRSESFFINPVA